MANNTEITVTDIIEAARDEYDSDIATAEWRGLTIKIKKHLSLVEMMTFAYNVTEGCFDDETSTYRPELEDYLIRCEIIRQYMGITLPSDVSDAYDFVYKTDLIPFVMDYIDKSEFSPLLKAIDRKIENRAEGNIQAVTSEMNRVISEFDSLQENLSTMFEGIDNETITKIAESVVDGGFDEDMLKTSFK